MKYIITSAQPASGRMPHKLVLRDEQGNEQDNVAAWPDTWHYSELAVGSEVHGFIESVQKGQYVNKSLKKPAPAMGMAQPSGAAPFAPRRGNGIAQAMVRKEEGIQRAQDNKESGIILSATFRDATILTVAQFTGKEVFPEDMKLAWTKWRGWLLDQYSKDPREAEKPAAPSTTDDNYINPEDIPF